MPSKLFFKTRIFYSLIITHDYINTIDLFLPILCENCKSMTNITKLGQIIFIALILIDLDILSIFGNSHII